VDVSSQCRQHLATRANGQPAIGCYIRAAGQAAYEPWVLDVLTLEGGQIAGVHAFIVAEHVRQPGHEARSRPRTLPVSACLPSARARLSRAGPGTG
jgi:hypothetical protein